MIPEPRNRYVSPVQAAEGVQVDAGLRRHMLGVYNYMASGLAVSGLVAFLLARVPALQEIFFRIAETPQGPALAPNALGFAAIIAPLLILLFGSFMINRLRVGTIQMLYWAFVALQGVGLSLLFQYYTDTSIVRTLFVTAAAFAGLSLYGYTTRRSLSAMGSFMTMGLFGLLIAMIVNMIWPAPALYFAISAAGVLIFSGLIAWQTQAIRNEYSETMDPDMLAKSAIFSALSLYLNFINLFQFLLSFMGSSRE
ncbi:MAG: Bax inhibitor-1/YccA family protein [Pseudomonadota bacterium]|nr:Bax inhibitor-1/YccA family protein [Pseudomonadota bacterium]